MQPTNTQAVQEAIHVLQAAQQKVNNLLETNSNLQLQSDHVLKRLIDGLYFAVHRSVSIIEHSQFSPVSLTKALTEKGVPKTNEYQQHELSNVLQDINDEVESLRKKAEQLYINFRDLDNKEIREALTEIEIRAVAKLAGIGPTEQPAEIDSSFIDIIKKSITEKEELRKAQTAILDAERSKEDLNSEATKNKKVNSKSRKR